jgi:hypothetical protein
MKPGINDQPCPFSLQQIVLNSLINRDYVTLYTD